MDYTDAVAKLKAVVFDTEMFSDSIEYNGETIPADLEWPEKPTGTQGGVKASVLVTVQKSDVPDPEYRDEIIIDSVSYRMKRRVEGDAISWKLEAAIEKPSYRGS